MTGMDYDSSATSSVGNVKGIKVPLVIIAHTAHYFNRPDEIIYDTASTRIRQLRSMKAPYTAVRRVLLALSRSILLSPQRRLMPILATP